MAAIVHSQMLKLYAGPRSISGSFGASPSQAVVTAYLSQPSCVLSANAEGVVEDYAPASTTIVVEVSGRTDTGNWTISTTKSTSVGTVTVVGATVSVSGMTDDAGWVDITASKVGYESVTRRFTLAKVRQKGGVRVATTLPANPSEVGGELAIFLDVADPALRGMYGWSGTEWVSTSGLLDGSVTADKLAADAIQATKFANGIEPVSIVNLLPNVVGYTGTKLVFLTTDNKLYRYTGSSWVKELPAEDLTGQLVADQLASNSVTTGKIQAGAVTTDQLAARAVTASKLVLTDTSNIYPDYDILDSSFYSGAAFTRVASTSLNLGAYALRIAANAAESRVESQWFQVEPSAEYFVELSAYQSISGTTGAAAAYIEFGSFSGGETTPTVTRSELVLRRVNTTSLARADVAVTTASNERKARLVFIREAGGTGVAEFGGPVIRRRNNAKLIVDGSIVATKIATDAVQTHHLLAGAVTAEKLTVNKLSAITADMGDVTAGTLTLSSTGYIRGGATSFSAGTGFWMGYHDGTYKMRAGTPGSSGFEWTGSAFNVRGPDGSITISSGVVDWDKIGGAGKTAVETNASTALANANAANNTLADIASDNKLTPVEKQSAANEWGIINRERASIQAQASALGISSELNDYNYTYAVLNDYITPLLADLQSPSAIDGPTFRDKWSYFYEYRQRLMNKMSAVAATKADWASVQGSGKPEDGATVGADWNSNLANRPSNAQLLNNLLDTSTWTGPSHGGVPGFNPNGSDYEQYRYHRTLPDGSQGLSWYCYPGLYHNNAYGWDNPLPGSSPAGDADGGWNTTSFPITSSRGYRFSVWVCHTGGNTGTAYLGCASNSVRDMGGGAVNPNPYFVVHGISGLIVDRWYLFVGYVHPEGRGGEGQTSLSGIYDGTTGAKVASGTDYCWAAGATTSLHRAYLYYAAPGSHLNFVWPRVDMLNGMEPSLAQLLAMGSVSARNPVTPSNVTTYIANAAIGNTQIGGNLWSTNWNYAGGTGWLLDRSGNFYGNNIYARGDIEASSLKANTAMVNRANIVNAAVDTLQIAGNAVTIPVAASGTSSCQTPSVDFNSASLNVIVAGNSSLTSNSTASASGQVYLDLYRNGGLIRSWLVVYHHTVSGSKGGSVTSVFQDNPGAGAFYYTAELRLSANSSFTASNQSVSVLVLGTRR